jgi:hypothetical protein
VPVVAAEGHGQRIGILLLVTSTTRFYNGMGVHLKKIARVSPCFLQLKFLKRAFLSDMRQWWSRHWHRRRLYRRRHRCSRSGVKRKRNDAKGKKLVMVCKR